MTIIISGSTGVSGVDGSAGTPSLQGGDANTGFFYGSDILGFSTGGTERMRLDASGNLGLGVTPSAWSAYKVFQISGNNAVYANGNDELGFVQNAYYSGGWKYGTTGVAATWNYQYQGKTVWNTAPSGTAGNAISFTQAMTLDASGNLGIGATTAGSKLTIKNPAISGEQAIWSVQSASSTANIGTFSYNQTDDTMRLFNNSGYSASALLFGTNSTERMRIDSSGNVGIGTSSPSAKLHISGSSAVATQILDGNGGSNGGTLYFYADIAGGGNKFRSSVGGINISNGGSGLVFGTTTSGNTEPTERMRIDSSGNLLVGTTGTHGGAKFSVTSTNGYTMATYNTSDNYYPLRFLNTAGTVVGTIYSSASGTSFNTSSDYRLKENIQPMQCALAVVQQLNPVTYTWKADGSDGQGFIAHELQAVVPDCVTGEKDAVDEEGNPVYQGIDTSFLVATLTKAIQELKAELDATKAEVAALKGAA